ncbi:MAG: hypothetical protein AMXMBFR59_42510 [Rhodanobacteraceae bacterium]
MGDDAEYYIEQQEPERREQEAQCQARVDEDARRNRQWEKAAEKAKKSPPQSGNA